MLHNSRGGRLIHSDDVFLHINKEMLCHLHSNPFDFFAIFYKQKVCLSLYQINLKVFKVLNCSYCKIISQ